MGYSDCIMGCLKNECCKAEASNSPQTGYGPQGTSWTGSAEPAEALTGIVVAAGLASVMVEVQGYPVADDQIL